MFYKDDNNLIIYGIISISLLALFLELIIIGLR
jgi:aryl carrier-like protein